MNIKKFITTKNLTAIISFIIVLFTYLWFRTNFSEHRRINLPFNIEKNAYFQISSPESVNLNQTFKVVVSLDTQKLAVNAIGLNLNYESEKLRVVNIDTTQSFCQFYPEKKFNDNVGKINLSCGSPEPGFTGQNDVLIIEFKSIKIGNTSIIMDPQSKILLSDGKGSNVLREFPQTQVKIINSL
jgi:hypothetical protein